MFFEMNKKKEQAMITLQEWQFLLPYGIHKWLSWFNKSVIANFLFLFLFLMHHTATHNIGLGSYYFEFESFMKQHSQFFDDVTLN